MHILNEKFEKVVCINLSERPDKRERMQARFDRLGIDVEWYTAVKYGFANKLTTAINNSKIGKFNINQPNELGAALSHYSVIKQALNEGIENLFVFEDDVLFHENFNARIRSALNSHLPNDWHMLMLYSFMYKIYPQNMKINPYWMKAYKSWSLVAYGMNEELMKNYIYIQDSNFNIADVVTYNFQENINFNIYTTAPSLVIPDLKFGSDIRTNMNYVNNPTAVNIGIDSSKYNDI